MMNGRRPFFNRLCKLVDLPVLGFLLYQLNVNRVVVRYMAAGHVYADPAWLSDERQREKLAVARARGSRFASIRFVTGELDPVETREQFLALARQHPDADGLWGSDAATIACRDGSARDD